MTRTYKLPRQLALVYQVGLANVFDVSGEPCRLLQDAYLPCECFCRGAVASGATVRVAHCDLAGDIRSLSDQWRDGPGQLWSDRKSPPDYLGPDDDESDPQT